MGCDRCFDGLVASYSEPHRPCNTLQHLDFIFDRLERHAGAAREPDRLAFMVWYHDVIYDPLSKENEELSARLAIAELSELGLIPGIAGRVAKLIQATATHQTAEADADDALFLDADFAILGADPDTYRRYVASVRFEYVHVDDSGWRAGRGGFLSAARAAPRLFRTDVFEEAYGAAARANVAVELAEFT